ncbi:hypothetical protein BH11ACT6_BH11ACT6_35010 [soil metagenome]
MSLPLGGGGVTGDAWWLQEAAAQPISTMTTTRAQGAFEAFYKGKVKQSPAYLNAADLVWEGLRRTASLPLAIIEAVVNQAFNLVGSVFDSAADALSAVAEFFGLKWRGIDEAQDAASYALAQLAVQNRPIVDTFDGTSGALSASPDWDVVLSGGPGGQPVINGNGRVGWSVASFGGTRTALCRYKPLQTLTDTQVVSTVMPSKVSAPRFGIESHLYVMGRMNDAGPPDTGTWGRASHNGAALGSVVAGAWTTFQSVPVTVGNSDTWDLWLGTSDVNELVWIRNGVPVITLPSTDYDFSSIPLGPGYRSAGFAMTAGDRDFLSTQTSPGNMTVFSADDRTP